MFKRKLTALNYASADSFNITDESQFRNLILWLEDQVICRYKIEEREPLRALNSPDWPKAFEQYLLDVDCPIKSQNRAQLADWLLTQGIRLEVSDNVEKYKAHLDVKPQTGDPKIVPVNPLDDLSFESADFKAGVNSLAQLLNVPQHPDHLITLEAVCRIVKERLNETSLSAPSTPYPEGDAVPFPIVESELGFETGDKVLNQAAKILRLLFIQDVRDLQTKVNECIVSVQNLTANPKTDTKIGKVGTKIGKGDS
nr:EOG090X0ARU [Lepidurus arcticus]